MPHIPPFQPNPRLFPFRSRWFDSSVGRIHYVDEGEGLPILLLHGNPTWSFLYRGVIVRLRKRFRCIAPDYPGFGLSEHPREFEYSPRNLAGVVGELVRHLDLVDLTITGQDWGGPIGMKTALDHVGRLRALVMGNTWYWPAEAVHMKVFAKVMSSSPMQWLIRERNFFVERMIPWGTKRAVAPEVMDHYRQCFPTPASRTAVAELPGQIVSASFWLGEIAHAVPRMLGNVPILLTWGENDLAFPPRFIDRFREDFKLAQVTRLAAGHYVQEDDPAGIASAVERFLMEQEAERI